MSRIRLAMVCALAFAAIYPQREAVADIVGVVYNPATGHYYKLSTSNANWQTAKTDSEALGGYLVCINSAAENSWLVTNGLAANTPWIGATDEASEGTWVWVSGETWSYTSWGGGEPNNAGNEDHVTIGSTGFWNDWNGGNGARYITEWNSDPNGPPEDPANLVATVLSDQRIDLRWDDLSSRETQFQVERASPAGGAFAQIAQLPTDTRTYSDTGVVGETQYSYRVRATGSAGPSGYTNTATVTTHPPTVTGLVATTVSNTKVQLTWVDQANSETGVEIERGLDSPGQGFGLIATQPADSVGYLDTTASPETLYSYRVRVVGAGGKSVYCPEASATTGPADPLAVTLLAPTDRLVTVTWYDASSLETGFEVQRAPGTPGTAFTTIGTSSANTPTYNDDTAQPETYYTYRVRTVGAQASSDWSAQAFITTPPFAPSNAVVEALSPTRIRLTWTDNTTREISQEVMRKGEADAFFQLLEVVGRNVT